MLILQWELNVATQDWKLMLPHEPRKWKLHQDFESNAPAMCLMEAAPWEIQGELGIPVLISILGFGGIAVYILWVCVPTFTFIQQDSAFQILDRSLQPSKVVDCLGLRISQT